MITVASTRFGALRGRSSIRRVGATQKVKTPVARADAVTMVPRYTVPPPRYLALRKLWNAFDSLGIFDRFPDWTEGEYGAYPRDTMDLLDADADDDTLRRYLRTVCEYRMSCVPPDLPDYLGFVAVLRAWYAEENEALVRIDAGCEDAGSRLIVERTSFIRHASPRRGRARSREDATPLGARSGRHRPASRRHG